MKIKHKAIIVSVLSVIFLIIVTCIIFYVSYFGYVNTERDKKIIQNFEVLDHIINHEKEKMKIMTTDWAHFDDTYQFVKDLNEDYIESNLGDNTFDTLNLKMMLFLNSQGNIIYSKSYKLENDIVNKLTEKLMIENKKNNYDKCGMLVINNRTFIISVSTVMDSNEKEESDDSLIFVREIDKNLLSYINNISSINLKIQSLEQENETCNKILNEAIKVKSTDLKYIKASKLIKDINDEESIIFNIVIEENVNISYYFIIFIIYFIVSVIIIGTLYLKFIDKYVLKKILKLNNFMADVTSKKDISLQIKICGNDEFSELANSTNKMLSSLNSAYKEITFLSYSDKLTNLKNRYYMEKKFLDIDDDKILNYFIIMADLNGLKLVNDTFGYEEGDKLISIVSNILKQECEEDDVISRWGGDEFIILIKNKDKNYVLNLISRIKESCTQVSYLHFDISIALGYAEKNDIYSNSESVMILAEERMNRNKLIESRSSRNSSIKSLLKTLYEKSSETEEHTMRIKKIGLKLGKKLGLTQDKLDELELLALLHDIGKIGIPEQILNKPAKLTDEEWTIMKTHTEIGYRIARATEEFSHISNEILYHHERYDGTGYPKGLKGDEIPLLSRIINVVDSFDVMTNKRVYKESSSIDYAIEELKRCSGTQFDPLLVNEFLNILNEEKNI